MLGIKDLSENEYEYGDNQAVQGEPRELGLPDQGDHGLASQQAGDEGCDETCRQAKRTDSSSQDRITSDYLKQVQELFAQDRYQDHEE